MKIEDKGIILSSQKYGERGIIVKILSENHGIVHGLASYSKKNNNYLQGNFVSFVWNARLETHLGSLKLDLEKSYPTMYYGDYQKVLAISSSCTLILEIFHEREKIQYIFDLYKSFLESLTSSEWLKLYSLLEFDLLSHSGFGFDLERCSESGVQDIHYISPKTGACVSEEVGKPYHDKLFRIPAHFINRLSFTESKEIVDGIAITRYFLARYIFEEKNKTAPFPYEEFYSQVLKLKDNYGDKIERSLQQRQS